MTTDNDPFAVPGGAPAQQPQQPQQDDPFAVPAAQSDPFAAPHVERGSWVPHRGSKIITFAVLGIAVPFVGIVFGIMAWTMGGRDLRRIRDAEMDPGGRGATMAGKIIGTVATFLNPLVWASNIASIAMN